MLRYLAVVISVFFVTFLIPAPTASQRRYDDNTPLTQRKPMIRILNLGDSYTIGEGVPPAARWPNRLVAQLQDKNLTLADPEIIAQTGWTTRDLLNAVEAAELTPPYDIVTLLIGVNNQYQGRSLEEYQEEFEQLLKKALVLSGMREHRTFVISIPDWTVTPYAHKLERTGETEQLNAFNKVNARLAYQYNVQYISVTEISRKAKTHPVQLLAEDLLHPSEYMYRLWLEEIHTKVRRSLTRPDLFEEHI